MRRVLITIAVISVFTGTTTRMRADIAYGVGDFMGFDAISGVGMLDTDTSTSSMIIHTPGIAWYGATDGLTPDTFFAIANPTYDPDDGPSQSELFEINTSTWTVTSLGPVTSTPGGGPIREIAMDESTGTLYGTDYANLYTINTINGSTSFVGSFSPGGTSPANAIDFAFSMDYDPVADELVAGSWSGDIDDDKTQLHQLRRPAVIPDATGLATPIGPTMVGRTTDLWFSSTSNTMWGMTRDGRILDIDSLTGAATVTGTTTDIRLNGLANATTGANRPQPFAPVVLGAYGHTISTPPALQMLVRELGGGMVRITTDVVNPNANSFGDSTVTGFIEVPIPEGGQLNDPVVVGAALYTWFGGGDPLTWDLVIRDRQENAGDPEIIYLEADHADDPWAYSFEVPAGNDLEYEFTHNGLLANYYLDLDIAAAHQTPEPASLLLLSMGAFSLAIRKRRR